MLYRLLPVALTLPLYIIRSILRGWLILFFLLKLYNLGFSQIPHFKQHSFPEKLDALDTAKNAPQLELNCITQTPDGILWIGSNRGLIRYNGLQTQFFPTQAAITALYSSPKQGLWLGCENGQIAFFYRNKIRLWEREEGLPKVKITGFAEDTLSNFWFSTYGEGAYCYDGKHLYNFNSEDNIAGNEVYTIISNQHGEVLLATDNGISICQFKDTKKAVKTLSTNDGLPDLIVKSFARIPLGEVSAGFYNGNIGDINTRNWIKIDGVVSSLSQFEKNCWIVGTEDNGLFFIDKIHNRTDKAPPSVGRRIQAVFNDNEGNLWVISDKNKLFSASCRFITYKTGLQNMQTIAPNGNNGLLIGTKEGVFNFNISTSQTQRFLPDKINVISLFNHFGSPFIGTFGSGLFLKSKYDTHTTHFDEKNGLNNLNVFSATTKDDTIWVATLGGIFRLLSKPSGWEIVNYNSKNGLSTDFIYKIFEDNQHRTWLGTDGKGAILFDGKNFHYFEKTHNGETLGSIVGITESPKGTIWLANTEGGIFYGNEAQGFIPLARTKGFERQSLTGLTVNSRGYIIALTSNGFDMIHPSQKTRVRFNTETGLTNFDSGLNPFCFEDMDNLWIVTSNELVRMPYTSNYQRTKPSPTIRGVKILMQSIDFQEVKSFSHSQNYFTFDIEGVWLTNPQAVRFRYKLEGLDPDWQATKETTLTYPNLPSGTYILRVQASLTDDFTGADEASYGFKIGKPLWQELWFILLMLALLGGIFYWILKSRENRLNREAALKQDKIISQLELLKSQISPHFLFNSFNTLIATIENDPNSAVEYTEHLSDFYRNILQVREKNVVSLQEELDMLKNYTFLLHKRHGDSLTIKTNIQSLDRSIVPMTLQLLVENAVKHNVVSSSRPLSISISETADGFIEVQNNIQKKFNIEAGTGFGLSSLVSRYELLTDTKLAIKESENIFLVRIPIV